ncbi:MAG: hypothetical protein A2086_01290 [Spirochaetes bacterium GWD1_27_9]|nr:MAG: hypothetical protein A2Y34_18815 [Spirochaetes bacterium GWC1_27_15]OHD44353.1 MAG: hypothetical protein A2086_01290 [Spirochaetes bacterium GWD1_27_9]
MNLNTDFKDFIELLNKNDVKYLLVGGYAVAYYGYPRYTKDIDIWIENTKENAEKLLDSLEKFGLKREELNKNDFVTEDNVIQLGYPPCRIDILTSIDGVNFDKCYENRNKVFVDELEINIINLNDLIINKKSTARYQDLADLEKLLPF